MSKPVPKDRSGQVPKKARHVWISHDDFYEGDFLRGWHFAVHRVHATSLGYSLIPHAKCGVKGYNHLLSEDGIRLTSRTLIFNTPLAASDWRAALNTDLRAIQISSASKGKDGYALVTLYRLNEARSGLMNDQILETTQSAVIAYLRYGSDFPPASERQESGS